MVEAVSHRWGTDFTDEMRGATEAHLPLKRENSEDTEKTKREFGFVFLCVLCVLCGSLMSFRIGAPSVAKLLLEHAQDVLRVLCLPQSWKDFLDAVTMRIDVAIGHRIGDQHDVVAQVVGAARG